MTLPVFNSRDSRCKTPFGAVPCGTPVTLTVYPPLEQGFVHCQVVLHHEFAKLQAHLDLDRQDDQDDRAVFSLQFLATPPAELLWYHFVFSREDGSTLSLDRSGYREDWQIQPWQLTVYDDTLPTPDWFGRGLSYQIFPDRFYRLAVPDPAGLPGERSVHENWDDAPHWWPDEHGVVRNSDFFGGSLQGIIEKLSHLERLGVTTLYLCPIFEAASNHRYDTGDYCTIDPMLGSEADFSALCQQAEKRGIRILLDGVFNHTGSDSRYFNAKGSYPDPGAAQSQDSPYASWYSFSDWPNQYDSWWGISTLPAVNESDPGYRDFIFGAATSVVRRWLELGAWGWRLDVADELPGDFIAGLRTAVDETKPGALLLGEVWEDGSNKIAYSQRRKYLLGHEVHGLMNYPFRNAVLALLLGGEAAAFQDAMEQLRENYPAPAFYSAMNFLGTHDTGRILTVLGASTVPESKEARSTYFLNPQERDVGSSRLRLAFLLLFTFPGSPTVYYGDEVGMEGFEDPFNRRSYPWGRGDESLLRYVIRLGQLRQQRNSLQRGGITYLAAEGRCLAFSRRWEQELSCIVVNAGDSPASLSLPWDYPVATDALTGQRFLTQAGRLALLLPPQDGLLLL